MIKIFYLYFYLYFGKTFVSRKYKLKSNDEKRHVKNNNNEYLSCFVIILVMLVMTICWDLSLYCIWDLSCAYYIDFAEIYYEIKFIIDNIKHNIMLYK